MLNKIIATLTNKKTILTPLQESFAGELRNGINLALQNALKVKQLNNKDAQEAIWTAQGIDEDENPTPSAKELLKDIKKTVMGPDLVMVCFKDKTGNLMGYKVADKGVLEEGPVFKPMLGYKSEDSKENEISFQYIDVKTFDQLVAYLQYGSVPNKGIYVDLYKAAHLYELDKFAKELWDDIKTKGLDLKTAKALFGLNDTQEFTQKDLNEIKEAPWFGIPPELQELAEETLQKSLVGVKEFSDELTGKQTVLSTLPVSTSPLPVSTADELRNGVNLAFQNALKATQLNNKDAQEAIWTAPGLDNKGNTTPSAKELLKDTEKTVMGQDQVMVCFRNEQGALLGYKEVERGVLELSDVLKEKLSNRGMQDVSKDELSLKNLDEERFDQLVAYLQYGSVPKKGIYVDLYLTAHQYGMQVLATELLTDIETKGLDVETAKGLFGLQEFTQADLNKIKNETFNGIPDELKILAIKALEKSLFGVREFLEELTVSESKNLLYEVDLTQDEGEIKTHCAVMTVDGVQNVLGNILGRAVVDLKAELNSIFQQAGVPTRPIGINDNIDQNGVLVNLDLPQQIALITYLVKPYPHLKERIGFYNLRASKAVSTELRKKGLSEDPNDSGKRISWFWPLQKDQEKARPEASIVSGSDFSLEDNTISHSNHFCFRNIPYGEWNGLPLDFHGDDGAMVVAGLYPFAL